MKFLAKPRFNWIDLMFVSLSVPVNLHWGWEINVLFLLVGGAISASLQWRAYGSIR